jgi:DNA-binding transcriptional regulator PaaX
MTPHQSKIIEFCRTFGGEITKKQACTLIPYYHNTEKYVASILTRMVRAGMLKRVKRGHYKATGTRSKPVIVIENQMNLF